MLSVHNGSFLSTDILAPSSQEVYLSFTEKRFFLNSQKVNQQNQKTTKVVFYSVTIVQRLFEIAVVSSFKRQNKA